MRIIDIGNPEPSAEELRQFWALDGFPTLVSPDGTSLTMYVTIGLDDDECCLTVESVWPRNPEMEAFCSHTWLERELDAAGLVSFGDLDARWMLREGIAPGQLVLLEFCGYYYKTWTDYGYEHDSDNSLEVLWKEPLSPDECAKRWESWLLATTADRVPAHLSWE